MKIAHILQSMRRAGAETATACLCRGMAVQGHEVHLITANDIFEYADELGGSSVKVHILKAHHGIHVRFFDVLTTRRIKSKISKVLTEIQPDIVHCHLNKSISWAAPAISRMRIPCVYTLHGYDGFIVGSSIRDKLLKLQFQQTASSTGCHFLAVSEPLARWLESSLTLPSGSVGVQKNPIDMRPFESVFRSAHAPKDIERALMVGTLYPLKRMDLGIRAAELLNQMASCELWIAGDGPQKDALMALAAGSRYSQRIRFLGTRYDIPQLLGQASCLLMLSQSEGFGMVMLEAMAAGVPVIATRSAGSALIDDRRNGLIAFSDEPQAVAEATLQLKTNEELRRGIIAAGRETAQEHNLERVCADVVGFYKTILRRHHIAES